MRKVPAAPEKVKLRRKAEARLKQRGKAKKNRHAERDPRKLVHELEVYQLELEMQNAELREARSKVEALLQTYTALYDFAPVGYLSIDELGTILEANLAGAALLGLERSRLINRRLQDFISVSARVRWEKFFDNILLSGEKQACSLLLTKAGGLGFSASLQGVAAASVRDGKKWIRLAVSDLTGFVPIEAPMRQVEGLTAPKRNLKHEISQRQKMGKALQASESHSALLLEQSQSLQEQMRHLSRQLLRSQEEERRRISRELHDEILQTLIGINVHLASLLGKAPGKRHDLEKKIVRTQKLVTKSVEIVHRFARDLRPTVLDDLGLIPALESFIRDFGKRTKLRIVFNAAPEVENLSNSKRTVFYRVAQAALTNVHNHARASSVKVILSLVRNSIRMEIRDNGKSFNVAHVLQAKRHRRLGLIGSRERVEMVGGNFVVESELGKGTTVRAEIPLRGG